MANRDKREPRTQWRRRGASATELAVILPLFITIVLGCIDFGRFAYTYIAVSNAARAGASWGMMNPPIVAYQTPWENSVAQAASNEMSQQPGFQSSDLTVSVPSITTESGTGTWRFTVTASYPFQTIITWNVGGYGIPHSFTLQQQVTMRGIRP